MYYKRIELSILLALIFTITLSCFDFSLECESIRNKVFRLHILANSNSGYDQMLKFKVRDKLIEYADESFNDCTNLESVKQKAVENLDDFQKEAEKELKKNGCNLPVSVTVTPCYFNTRTYENVTLPAGVYPALRVKIGEHKGKNWWCVMYPSLCLPSSSSKIDDALDDSETQLVQNKNKYIVKFKIVELFEFLKTKF